MYKLTITYSETQEFSHELLKDAKAFSYAIKTYEDRGLIPVASEEYKDKDCWLVYFGKTNGKNGKMKNFDFVSSYSTNP